VRDGGSGWTYPRDGAPNGVGQDEWLDLWTPSNEQAIKKGTEVDLVEREIDDKSPTPRGWSDKPNIPIPTNLKTIKDNLKK